MINIPNISGFKLSNYFSKEFIEKTDFNYSSVDGIAEIVGLHVIFFSDIKNLNETSVISLDEIQSNKKVETFANQLFFELSLGVEVKDKFEKIISIYGTPFSFDEIFENVKRYNYLLNNNDCFIAFGVDKYHGLNSIEIIQNKKILHGILNENWRG